MHLSTMPQTVVAGCVQQLHFQIQGLFKDFQGPKMLFSSTLHRHANMLDAKTVLNFKNCIFSCKTVLFKQMLIRQICKS